MTILHYNLSSQLGELLSKNAKTLSVAESCTGGGIAQAITDVPGSSQWFEVGFVTYSNAAKIKLLGMDPHTLAQYGAVSEEVVKGMLTGLLALSGADFGVTVSGIAGPSGATPGKSVGTVCIAFGDDNTACARTYRFLGSRSSVREQSVTSGLQNLLEFCVQKLS